MVGGGVQGAPPVLCATEGSSEASSPLLSMILLLARALKSLEVLQKNVSHPNTKKRPSFFLEMCICVKMHAKFG